MNYVDKVKEAQKTVAIHGAIIDEAVNRGFNSEMRKIAEGKSEYLNVLTNNPNRLEKTASYKEKRASFKKEMIKEAVLAGMADEFELMMGIDQTNVDADLKKEAQADGVIPDLDLGEERGRKTEGSTLSQYLSR